MQGRDRAELAKVLLPLGAVFRVELSEAIHAAYFDALEDFDLEQVRVGVRKALRVCRFFPSPAELRELSGEAPAELRAQLGWAAVRRAIRQHGHYAAVSFDDPLVNACVRGVGGWVMLCTAAPESFTWFKKDFVKLYVELAKHGAPPGETAPLLGALESERVRNVPVRLGLPTRPAAPPRLALAGARPDEENR